MKFQQWPKRDPDKNYFKVPNEVFHIGLSYPEISIYCYLLSIEDRGATPATRPSARRWA